MTTDHRAAAERMLADADEWAAQAGELSPKASERACLAYAAVHALLAIHDTLTAADRYAANEAKQREEADMDEVLALGRKAGKRWSRTLDLLKQAEAEDRKKAEPDPLDENNHQARTDKDGDTWVRYGYEHWHFPDDGVSGPCWDPELCDTSLRSVDAKYGPLAFAPDAVQKATGSASEADNTEEPLLCPECGPAGDSIDEHNARGCRYVMCDCKLSPSDIARVLIERTTRRGGRRG